MQLYHSLFLFPAAGCHFKGPLALRHSFSTALPIYSLSNLYYYTLIYKCLSTALLQSFAKHLSDLIPADLIGREMNFKALSVPCINSCILWFIGVIYHTILSVFHIGMNFHIITPRPFPKVFTAIWTSWSFWIRIFVSGSAKIFFLPSPKSTVPSVSSRIK